MFKIDSTKYRIVDLSYEVVPPGTKERPFIIKRGYLPDSAFKYDITCTHSHVGTHIESPAHFFDGGKDITAFPLTWFMGRAILLDVKDVKDSVKIGADALQKYIGDIIHENDIVICRNSDEKSLNSKNIDDKPYLSEKAAKWLAKYNIKMLGVDCVDFRIGRDIDEGREIHDILQSRDVCLIEYIAHLHDLIKREFFFMALPWKVKQMDSSWARAIAIEEI